MADTKRVAIHFKDGTSTWYDSFSDLNPALGSAGIATLASATASLTDGDLVKSVVTDTTTIFPTAGGDD